MEKIIIIGAVAAGTSAAAKARRNDESAEIVVYEKDTFISYSACGTPYFIGGEIKSVEELTPRDPAFFKKKYNIDVKTGHEVLCIDSEKKTVTVKNLLTEETFTDTYDQLILATGALPNVPNVEGMEKGNVFFLRNIHDASNIATYIKKNHPQNALIVGTGFIGFEIMENFLEKGIQVTMVEKSAKITPHLDTDMATYLEEKLLTKGVNILKETTVKSIGEGEVTLSTGDVLPLDIVVIATGVRPNTTLAKTAGITLGETGAIKVDEGMRTNLPDIFACGDCVETYCAITGKPTYRPLGSTANKTGRIAGDVATGGNLVYKGHVGTGIFKCLDITVATTGLSEKEALENGFEIALCHAIKPDKPAYMQGKEMTIKAVADKATGRLLGVQIIGEKGVDKRIDVFATLITLNATVDTLFHLDLAYAPPFSTTKDPVHYTGMILDNALHQGRELITATEIQHTHEPLQIIDVRSEKNVAQKGMVQGAVNIPVAVLRQTADTLDKTRPTVTYCNKGVTGNAAQNILQGKGFTNVRNLSGGYTFYKAISKGTKK